MTYVNNVLVDNRGLKCKPKSSYNIHITGRKSNHSHGVQDPPKIRGTFWKYLTKTNLTMKIEKKGTLRRIVIKILPLNSGVRSQVSKLNVQVQSTQSRITHPYCIRGLMPEETEHEPSYQQNSSKVVKKYVIILLVREQMPEQIQTETTNPQR